MQAVVLLPVAQDWLLQGEVWQSGGLVVLFAGSAEAEVLVLYRVLRSVLLPVSTADLPEFAAVLR